MPNGRLLPNLQLGARGEFEVAHLFPWGFAVKALCGNTHGIALQYPRDKYGREVLCLECVRRWRRPGRQPNKGA